MQPWCLHLNVWDYSLHWKWRFVCVCVCTRYISLSSIVLDFGCRLWGPECIQLALWCWSFRQKCWRMYILSLFYFFKEIKSQLWQERAGSLRRPPQCWEFIDSTGSLSLLSPAVYSLAAPRVFGQPPSASGFDVWCRLSSGQVVVAVAWASLTKCQEGCPVCNIHFHSLSPEAESVCVSATSGRPDCSAVPSSGVCWRQVCTLPVLWEEGPPLCVGEDSNSLCQVHC